MKPARRYVRRVFSSHARDRLKSIRELKRSFAELFFDPERFDQLAFKQPAGNLTWDERRELVVLQKLRSWKFDK